MWTCFFDVSQTESVTKPMVPVLLIFARWHMCLGNTVVIHSGAGKISVMDTRLTYTKFVLSG